jgi:hypothetical protein
MEWVFISEFSLKEKKSEYIIYLLSGTWAEPWDVISKFPKDMTSLQKARYLRLGLAFAKEFMQDFKQKTELEAL